MRFSENFKGCKSLVTYDDIIQKSVLCLAEQNMTFIAIDASTSMANENETAHSYKLAVHSEAVIAKAGLQCNNS